MKKNGLSLIMLLFMSLSFSSCFELEEDDDDSGSSTPVLNAGYSFTFTCPAGSTNTVPIPEGTAQCQQAYEYFAEVYGCNESDYFNAANCMMCTDCDLQNYCDICS